jgi:hypothetical protein
MDARTEACHRGRLPLTVQTDPLTVHLCDCNLGPARRTPLAEYPLRLSPVHDANKRKRPRTCMRGRKDVRTTVLPRTGLIPYQDGFLA